jgi:hypothetical protein
MSGLLIAGRGHNIKHLERSMYLLFSDNLADVLDCVGLLEITGYEQHAYIIHQYTNNFHSSETVQKKIMFYYIVSKALTNEFSFLPD